MSTNCEALKIKIQVQADINSPLPLFIATCAEPEISVTGRTLDELRLNLDRAIAETLSEEAGEGDVAARALLLEFAA